MQLPRRTPESFASSRRVAISPEITRAVQDIIDRVRDEGEAAVRDYAQRFNERTRDEPLYVTRSELETALAELAAQARMRLERTADRIRRFAQSQKDALGPVSIEIPGGEAGHSITPVRHAGCYGPGGRYPLPSSVLMTATAARVAGVDTVWVASPRPPPITLAAAAVAGADGLLAVGGAHAVAALAFGIGPVPPSDVIVGPGNVYVTAAKQILAGTVGIDMLAGPSELVIVADDSADPELVAADLLAQAEHDVDALPVLLTTSADLVARVEACVAAQLHDLPTAETARAALANGASVLCESRREMAEVADSISPEHLHLCVAEPRALLAHCHHYGAAFLGQDSAEVLGDYGAGPNHVLPTGRGARIKGGLSVLDFLRVRTWLEVRAEQAQALLEDVEWLAREEGLEAHARAARRRMGACKDPSP